MTESDVIEVRDGSQIQHGAGNDRIYLMKLDPADLPGLIGELDDLAAGQGYSKIFAKVPAGQVEPFLAHGYLEEARVPGFFEGREDGCFLGKYFTEERRREQKPDTVAEVLEASRAAEPASAELPEGYSGRIMTPADCPDMTVLYKRVFESYPFPIHDPAYLEETMADNVVYWGVFSPEGRLVALSSAEMYEESGNVEMTDFATHPDFRGRGLANYLLAQMEQEMADRGIATAYTIARAYSFGMNITFARNGYRFAGTLTHNTNIFGRLESMNIWYKPLRR